MLKLCPWKKDIVKHVNTTTSYDESGTWVSDCTNEDTSIDFGSCSNYACPFYDETGSVWCRRVTKGE